MFAITPKQILRGAALALALAAFLAAGIPAGPLAAQPAPPAQRPSGPPQTPGQRATVPPGATVGLGTVRVTNQSPTDAADVSLAGDQLSITVAGDLLVAVEGRTCAVAQSAEAYTCTVAVAPNASVSFDIDGGGRGVQRPVPPPVQTGTTARAAPSPSPASVGAVPSGVSVPPVATVPTVPALQTTTPAVPAPAPQAAIAATTAVPAPAPAVAAPAAAAPAAPASQAQPAPVAPAPGGAVQLPRTGTGLAADTELGLLHLAGMLTLLALLFAGALAVRARSPRRGV